MHPWEYNFASRIVERGRRYYRGHRVYGLQFDDEGNFSASVRGSRLYHVSGNYDADGRLSNLVCNCPYATDGNLCKHMAAVLFAIDAHHPHQEKVQLGPLVEFQKVSKHKLDYPQRFINPLEIVGAEKFPLTIVNEIAEDHQTVKIFNKGLIHPSSDTSFSERNNDIHPIMNQWIFVLLGSYQQQDFNVSLRFSRHQLINKSIEFPSLVSEQDKYTFYLIAVTVLAQELVNHDLSDSTDRAAQHFLQSLDPREASSPVIEAHLDSGWNENEHYLTFRVGTDGHMYKLQNIVELATAIRLNEPLHLGKYFHQTIDPNQLDQSSHLWLDFINHLVDTAQLLQSYDGQNRWKKQLPVSGFIADDIDNVLKRGGKVYNNNFSYPLERISKPIRPQLLVNRIGKPGDPQRALQAQIIFPNEEDIVEGQNHYYRISTFNWQVSDGISPLELDRLTNGNSDNQFLFGTGSMAQFYHKVLPQLKEQFNVHLPKHVKDEHFIPPLALPVYLLDYVNGQVKCGFAVDFDGQIFNIDESPRPIPDSLIEDMKKQAAKALGIDFSAENFALPVDQADDFLDHGLNELKTSGQVRVTAAFRRLLRQAPHHFHLSASVSGSLLNLKITGDKLSADEINQILSEYQLGRRYYLLKDQRVVRVDSKALDQLHQLTKQLDVDPTTADSGGMQLPAYRAMALNSSMKDLSSIGYQPTKSLSQFVSDLEKPGKGVKLPQKLQKILRPYQRDGAKWMITLAQHSLGGLLADEMGLGKSVQAITLIVSNHKEGISLIVCPAAVVYNWRDEFKKFVPQLTISVVDGSAQERKAIISNSKHVNVLITSYDSLKRDMEQYQVMHINNEIIDEAQYIKNPQTKAARAVKQINARHRFALTGTPIENRLSELWSIFDFLMPGFLGTYQKYKRRFEKPITDNQDKMAMKELKSMVQPFILRRLKQQVLKDLPDKNEEVVAVPLVGKQGQLYNAYAQRLLAQLKHEDDKTFRNHQMQILAELTRLRQICCSPKLIDEHFRGHARKVDACLKLIKKETNSGHKILLFSQFTSLLAIMAARLKRAKISYFVIEGQTPKKKRLELVKQFNETKQPAVFLISLKAGGTGLNLTSADIVIHFDPWWNVAAENQATDRAHRIGQHHDVQIYKLIAKDTIEERIINLQKQKSALATAILSGKEIKSAKFDRKTLLKILE